ncbi:cell division septal protein FtsQ [Actinoplanes lutulentus]|uniref:DUF5666 domain-containing protein n=1 Tax=Actinoplanes lutulentus TaxID=1287878 RepID=A0A327ZBJ5_9ACTN|nr:hypothetical protein [Actinoplanes lutulentus]MBB2946826.1 cell division septal protein FtsQ [Actinoplanes lutulentus]RAK35718.1 hypothetical protein B0I29_109192 [Actinoplanes lutulentus]
MDSDTEVLPRTDDDLNSAIAAAAPKRWWNRTTLALLGLVLAVGGFLGGVQAQERWGSSSSPASSFPRNAGMPSGGGGFGGQRPDAAASASGTSGTVKLIDGTTLYVETDAGETITVRTNDTTAVKLSETTTLDKLVSGQQVTVVGAADTEGIVTATTVTAG